MISALCPVCGKTFIKRSNQKYCSKDCKKIGYNQKEYHRNYYLLHKEEILLRTKLHRINNLEEHKLYSKEYNLRPETKERQRLYRIEYKKTHPKRISTWYAKNKEICREKRKEARRKVLNHYSGIPPKCACCGEDTNQFLTIDHIDKTTVNPKYRASTKLFKWLIDNNYPEGYQILCFNCNCGKQVNGDVCPHKQKV